MVRYFVWGALALGSLVGTAAAQTPSGGSELAPCSDQVGRVIAPADGEEVARKLSSGTQARGEFETTDAYQARMAAAIERAPPSLFVGIPLDTKYITYDADAGAFAVQSYAVDNHNASWEVFNKTAQLPWTFSGGSPYVDLVLISLEVVTGTYTASNAYGASTTVRQISRTTLGILERPAAGREDLFFPDRPWDPLATNVIANVPVPSAQAPIWRSKLKAAALIQPKAPFLVRGTKDWGAAKMDRPKETNETLTAIIADIRCVVLTDENNRVLASIPTR